MDFVNGTCYSGHAENSVWLIDWLLDKGDGTSYDSSRLESDWTNLNLPPPQLSLHPQFSRRNIVGVKDSLRRKSRPYQRRQRIVCFINSSISYHATRRIWALCCSIYCIYCQRSAVSSRNFLTFRRHMPCRLLEIFFHSSSPPLFSSTNKHWLCIHHAYDSSCLHRNSDY